MVGCNRRNRTADRQRRLAKGHSVVALVRSKASANLPGVDMIEGDARDEGTIIRGLNGCDGVVSSLGTGLSPFRKVSLLTVATGALVTAMTRNGVRCLSASAPWGRGQPAVAHESKTPTSGGPMR